MDYTTRVFSYTPSNIDDPIFVDADRADYQVSWKTYASYVKRIAVGLRNQGVRPGECIGLLSTSDIYFWVLADGIIAAGAIFCPIPLVEREDQLETFTTTAAVDWLFVSPEHVSLAARTSAKVLIFDPPGNTRELCEDDDRVLFSALLGRESDWKPEDFGSPQERIALRMFTSGSSGGVKAVEISHAALVARIDAKDFEPGPNDRSQLQFIHLASTSSQMICQRAAAGYLAIHVTQHEDELTIIDRIESGQISMVQLPPRTMELIADAIETGKRPAESLKSLNHILVGGSPSHKDQVKRFASLIPPHIFLRTGYGSTEGGMIAMTPPSHSWFEKGTVGLITPGVELRILDYDTLEPSSDGEICIRSTSLFSKYHNNPSTTSKTLIADQAGPWLRTGDRGYIDSSNGQLAVTGRFNEMITIGTVRIIPSEIEAELLNHPSISDAAITTTRLQGWEGEEKCLAYIVKKRQDLTAGEVRDFVAARISKAKAPSGVVFCERIPRNAAMKPVRRDLRLLEHLPGSVRDIAA